MRDFIIILSLGLSVGDLVAQPTWQVDPNDFQYSMTVTGLLEVDGEELSSSGDMVGAFHNTEVRGVAKPIVYIASLDKYLAFLTVFSNSVTGEDINFKLYNSSSNQEADALQSVQFTDGGQIGANTSPQLLTNVYEWDGLQWINQTIPSTGSSVRFKADYSTSSSNLDFHFVEVEAGVVISVGNNEFLKVSGRFKNDGTVNVVSGGSLVTLGNVTGTGFSVSRETTFDQATGRYSIVGSPIQQASFDVLGSNALVYAYDETEAYENGQSSGANRFKSPADINELNMVTGKGYFSAFTGEATGLVTFQGSINTGTINIPLSYTDHQITSETPFQGYNLIANPYPSAISFQSFISENSTSNIDETIYIWDDFDSENSRGTNQDYLVVNATLGTTDSRNSGVVKWDGFIRSGQGFFVKANASTNLIFTDDMKETGNNDDAGFFRQSKVERYKLKLEGNEQSRAIILGFLSDATPSKDQAYDALAMSNADFQFYSTNPAGNKLAIQGLPKRYEEPISLMFQTREIGTYSIGLMNLQEVNNSVWLYDKITSQYVDLSIQAYDFNVSSPGYSDRFRISRKKEVLALKEPRNWNAYISNGYIKVEQQRFSTTKQYKLVSLAGHTIISSTIDEEPWFVGNLPSGLYLISDDINTQKIIVK